MKLIPLALSALVALGAVHSWAQTSQLSTVAITTGVVTITERVGTPTNRPGTVGNNLAGLAYVAGNVPAAVDTSISFFTLTGSTLPPNPADAFTSYGTLISPTAVGSFSDVAAALTGSSYSGLAFAIDDLGLPIAGTFYTIHHRPTGDYFANIVPRTGGNSSSVDLKPMSWQGGVAGGPTDPGTTGYFGLAFVSGAVTGYSANSMFYLRTDGANTRFGEMIPALTAASTDKINLTTAVGSFGVGGYTTLAYSPTAFGGYAANQFYYLRLDSVTGNTVLGRLDPSLVPGVRTISDIANLGGVFKTLNYAFDATGPAGVWGINQLYATGSRSATAQSVSFAAIADRAIASGSFTVTPSASSGLGIALTVVTGSTGSASISGPAAGVFTVTPLSPGVITLQATQSGGAFASNMLRQSFNATGVAALVITTQPTSQSAVTGTTASFSVVASGSSAISYQWRKGGFNIVGNPSATTATLSLPSVVALDAANYDVVVTNLAGSVPSDTVTLTVTTATPVITNAPLTAAGTVGSLFSFTITATNTPTSYSATPLPAGLVINTVTGAITGTPTTVGTTNVLLGATNAGGTGNATLVVTVAAAGVPPVITSPLTAAGTVATAFSYTITATNSPTSFAASPLPAGLVVNTTTGAITGTPTTVGTTNVLLGATNAFGTGNATLVVTVAAAGVAPVITSPLTAAGTVGTPFSYTVTATNSPTSYTATPLPAGLSIVALTGVITGTPTTVGTTNVLLGATNAFGTGNATLVITVAAAGVAPVITSPLTAAGTVGTPFSYAITATNTPTSYTATPLPAGLSIVALTGVITGTPTTVGTTNVVLGATNAFGTGNATLVITVAAAGVAPVITSPLTAAGTVGTPFGYTITATNTPTSYTASPLPAGLSIVTATGVITGTPTTVGTTNVILGATNAFGTGNATLVITVAAAGVAPVITSPLTAAGTVGTSFGYTITATNSPTSYSASPLPAGLSIVTATGVITGTPTTVGTTNVILGATNAFGTGNATLVITVAAAGVAPVITSPLTAAGTVGTAFSYTITATNTPTSYTASPLPAGLSIVGATGVITGIPATVGTTNVLLGATNAFGTGNATLVITVAAAGVAPVITSPLTAGGTVGTAFGYTITATNTPTSYTASPLPAGLSIVAATGVITGTPTTVGTTNVLLGATNAFGTGNATLVVTVAAAGVAPVVTSPLTAGGTVGTAFGYTITATNSPTSYTASPLPAGLSIVAATGVITGTPTTVGTTNVLLGATNAFGTDNATLVITVAAAGVAPDISSPLTAAGTVGTAFSYGVTATGSPNAYTAAGLPAGLSIVAATGAITGTPTSAGSTSVVLGATNAFGTDNVTLVITVGALGAAPNITNNPLTTAGTVGTPFSFRIVATGSPLDYGAAGLPPGLRINVLTGVITGTPTTAGTSVGAITARNDGGSDATTLTFVIGTVNSAPVIASPTNAVGTVGRPFVTYLITATGLPTSYTATNLPPGLSLNALTGAINGTPTAAGTTFTTLTATNSFGSGTATLMLVIAPATGAPIFTSPTGTTGTVGTPFVTYLITATGQPTAYTATGLPPGLTLNPVTGAINGTPTVAGTSVVTLTATNANGTTSANVTIVISGAASVASSQIVNFAARAISGPGSESLIMGFVVAGEGTNLLVRGIGPGLAPYGVTDVLEDPFLTLFDTAGAIATNDDWQTNTAGPSNAALIASTAARVGAFALPAGSKDSALLLAVNKGAHTTGLVRPNSTSGVALTEIYDIDRKSGTRLINVSARMHVTAGEGTLIAGFVIVGNAPATVLIRGVGPTLSVFGVTGVLADPTIAVFAGSARIATNDNWSTEAAPAAAITQASARSGAFALPAGSKDAALLLTLQPGTYTVQVTGVAATTGVALIEIYDTL
jgi:hypothetical protein